MCNYCGKPEQRGGHMKKVVIYAEPRIFVVGSLLLLALMAAPFGLYILNHAGITIHKAAEIGDVDHVREILEINPDEANRPDQDGNRPLHIAAAYGRIAVINALVQAGADMLAVNRSGDDAFEIARLMGREEAYDFLLSCFWQKQGKRIRRPTPNIRTLSLASSLRTGGAFFNGI